MTRAIPWLTAAVVVMATPAFAQDPTTSSPAPQPQQQQTQPADSTQKDSARAHLAEARRVLSEVTTMPQAAQLQGEARAQVSQLITNFNALITAQSNWKEKYAGVEQNLNTLLGASAGAPATGTTGTSTPSAVGTSGTAAATSGGSITLDPAIRAKLEEFKRHLTAFSAAAGASAASSESPADTAPSSTASAPPSTAPPSAAPSSPAPPTETSAPPATAAAGTAAPSEGDAGWASQIDDIEKMLAGASCDPAKVVEIRTKLAQLRQTIKDKK